MAPVCNPLTQMSSTLGIHSLFHPSENNLLRRTGEVPGKGQEIREICVGMAVYQLKAESTALLRKVT